MGHARKIALQALLDGQVAIQERLDHLIMLMANPTHRHTGKEELLPLLQGWEAVARFTGKSPSTLRRYRQKLGFPVYRWGRGVVSHPEMIFRWLQVVDQEKRKIGWKFVGRSDSKSRPRHGTGARLKGKP